MTSAPWLRVAAECRWRARAHLDEMRTPEARALVEEHLRHLDRVLRELRAERERRAA